MNKELLTNIRNILIPTLASRLKKTNYEGQGENDAIEFTHDMTEIFDLAEQQLSAKPHRWTSVDEALPEEDGYYLVTGKKQSVYITGYSNGRWYGGIAPIAWMERPEPYKE